MKPRLLFNEIIELLNYLCEKANIILPLNKMNIHQLPNKQFGFRISFDSTNAGSASLGSIISNTSWKDTDGLPAFATLSADNKGNLFEIDIWKSNFSIPSTLKTFR